MRLRYQGTYLTTSVIYSSLPVVYELFLRVELHGINESRGKGKSHLGTVYIVLSPALDSPNSPYE